MHSHRGSPSAGSWSTKAVAGKCGEAQGLGIGFTPASLLNTNKVHVDLTAQRGQIYWLLNGGCRSIYDDYHTLKWAFITFVREKSFLPRYIRDIHIETDSNMNLAYHIIRQPAQESFTCMPVFQLLMAETGPGR